MLALASTILHYLNEGIEALGLESEIVWSRNYGGVYLIQELMKKLGIV
ncbi:MAG: hypothetical protein ACE5LC_06025 [Candidatus Aminicenantales bacterium]